MNEFGANASVNLCSAADLMMVYSGFGLRFSINYVFSGWRRGLRSELRAEIVVCELGCCVGIGCFAWRCKNL